MKRFAFRLESVLKYRESLQNEAQRDLYRAKKAYMALETEIDRMHGRKREIGSVCREKEMTGIDVPSYQILRSFMNALDDDITNAKVELEKIGHKILLKTDVLKKALMKKKTLESLKESQREAHRIAAEKEHQKGLDELTIIRRGLTV